LFKEKNIKKQTSSSFVFTAFAKQKIIGIFFPETNQQAKLALALFLCRSLVKMEIEFSLGASAFDQLYSLRLRSQKNSSFSHNNNLCQCSRKIRFFLEQQPSSVKPKNGSISLQSVLSAFVSEAANSVFFF